jgi:OOP family OmpA-OmpF porin
MKIKALAAIALLAASVTPALAGDIYVLGAIGRSSVYEDNSQIDRELVSAGATNVSSSIDRTDTGYKLQLGYQFNPNFAVEGGYVSLGKMKYSATFTGGSATLEGKASGWNIAAVGILPINDAFSAFGKLGVIRAKLETNVSATGPGGSASGSTNATNWKPTWGFGGIYNINKAVGVRLEYERFQKLGDNDTTGQPNVDLLSAGVAYKF